MSRRSKATTLKGSTALTSTKDKAVPAITSKPKRSKIALPVADPLTPQTSEPDPLVAVSELLAELPSETAHVTQAKVSDEAAAATPSNDPTTKPTPWDYSAKLLEFGHETTMCTIDFAGRYATAMTPQDVLSVTADLYREQGRLFKEHSEHLLDMISSAKIPTIAAHP